MINQTIIDIHIYKKTFNNQIEFCWFKGEGLPQLAWFSPNVVSRPKDWPETSYLVGYPFLKTPADYSPPLELDQFLKQPGCMQKKNMNEKQTWNEKYIEKKKKIAPPVYIGFGSMPVPSLETLARDFVEVLEKLNLRGLFFPILNKILTLKFYLFWIFFI